MTMAQATEITPVMLASKIAFEQLQQQMNDKTIDAFMALPELFEGNGDAQHKLEECILQLVDNDTKCQCAAQALQEVRNARGCCIKVIAAEAAADPGMLRTRASWALPHPGLVCADVASHALFFMGPKGQLHAMLILGILARLPQVPPWLLHNANLLHPGCEFAHAGSSAPVLPWLLPDACHGLPCQGGARMQVGSTYAAADTAQRRDTDLQDALNACSVTVLEGHPGHTNPKTTAVWKQWCEETGQEAEDDDDDDMQVGKGAEFKNNKCLLSAISIYEMKDPVFDHHKFVYERQKVVGYIKQGGNGNSNAHPSRQGEQITLQELKPAKRVKMAGEKWRREQALHRTQAADDEEIL